MNSADMMFIEELEAARQMDGGEKLLAGPRLFRQVCARIEAGVRVQFPQASEEEVQRIVDQRLERISQIEAAGCSEEELQQFLSPGRNAND